MSGSPADLADRGFVPVTWNGQETYAKAGEWVVGFNRSVADLGEVNGRLSRLRDDVQATRKLGNGKGMLLEAPASVDATSIRQLLKGLGDVAYVEPNFLMTATQAPNDPSYGSLWGMNSANDADVDAPEAWDSTTGSMDQVVGVVDTGVDYTHPDLYENIWINQAEIPSTVRPNLTDTDRDDQITFLDLNQAINRGAGKILDVDGNNVINGKDILAPYASGGWDDNTDADGNTYSDDLIGWNFVTDTNDPMDDQGHGTHVSGTVAARGNNATGVVGVNWQAQVMGLKFLDSTGSGTSADAIAATDYATNQRQIGGVNINVTNHSYGGEPFSRAFYEAIGRNEAAGMLFVGGAGNGTWYGSPINNDNTPFYPASYGHDGKQFDDPGTPEVETLPSLNNVISVTATDTNDAKASWANYGLKSVDVAAPGVNIYSLAIGGGYKNNTGTSMASPHVAGAAALLWSASPGASLTDVKSALLTGGDAKTSLATNTSTGRRLSLSGSLAKLPPTVAPATPEGLAAKAVSSGRIDLTWNDVSGEAGYSIERSVGASGTWAALATVGANTTSFSDTTVQPSTAYSYRVKATNPPFESGYSAVASAATPVFETPAAPTGLKAAPDGSSRVNLEWTDNGYEAGFKLRRYTSGVLEKEILVAGNGDAKGIITYADTGLKAGTTYSYQVVAYNGSVESAASPSPMEPAVSATTATAAPVGTGTGLRGRYYDNSSFGSLKMTRVDNNTGTGRVAGSTGVDFNWANGSPTSSMGVDTFSVRWQGQVQPRFSENYTFYVKADDGVRLWVNGELQVNIWRSNTSTWSGVPLSLTAGQKYDIQMDYYEGSGGAMAKLMWWSPSLSKDVIPQTIPATQLYAYATDPVAKTVPAGTPDKGTYISSVGGRTAAAAPAAVDPSAAKTEKDRRLVEDLLA